MKKLCLGLANLFFFVWIPILAAQTPKAPSAPPETAPSPVVSEAAIATGMEGMAPQGAADSFESSVGKVYAFTKITGAQGETSIKHLWFHGDHLAAEVELPVKSSSWRTYSSKTITPGMTGPWKVDVTTPDGTVLKSIPFTIK